jgi:hypothetical protein
MQKQQPGMHRRTAAPARSCEPRPRGASMTRAPAARATAAVPSRDPPSETTISATGEDEPRDVSVADNSRSAFKVGITRLSIAWAGVACAKSH